MRAFSLPAILAAHSWKLAMAFVLIGTARIASVYPVYNHTIDEPAHIACGMEWLSRGQYKLEAQHPPLARIFNALIPYLDGARSLGRTGVYQEGAAILTAEGSYQRRLTQARAGTLLFFWLACGAVYWLATMEHGGATGSLAALLFSATPGILGHAGLATTDMALTATFVLAAAAFVWWAKRPGSIRAGVFGAACGLLLAAKFSALYFLPLFLAVWLILRRSAVKPLLAPRNLGTLAVALAAGLLTVWGVYRFSFGPTPYGFSSPAPELFAGIEQAREHNAQGHPSYLLGSRNQGGFPAYYPVAFAVKTPLPLLLAALTGWWMIWKKRRDGAVAVLAIAASMLATGFVSNINIGTRHLLPLYAAFAIGGAVCLHSWLQPQTRRPWLAGAAGVLLVLFLIGPAMDHPDYLPYFNLLGGSEPEKILVDSDLDWGQDMLRLSHRLHELGAPYVVFSPFIVANWHRDFGFPPIAAARPDTPLPGWNAVSLTLWKASRFGLGEANPELILWPEKYPPAERVGRGVLLYYFDPKLFPNPPQLERFPSP